MKLNIYIFTYFENEMMKKCVLFVITELGLPITSIYRVRNFRGRVTNFDQSEARKHCFLDSDWSKFVTLPRKFRTLYPQYLKKRKVLITRSTKEEKFQHKN